MRRLDHLAINAVRSPPPRSIVFPQVSVPPVASPPLAPVAVRVSPLSTTHL